MPASPVNRRRTIEPHRLLPPAPHRDQFDRDTHLVGDHRQVLAAPSLRGARIEGGAELERREHVGLDRQRRGGRQHADHGVRLAAEDHRAAHRGRAHVVAII